MITYQPRIAVSGLWVQLDIVVEEGSPVGQQAFYAWLIRAYIRTYVHTYVPTFAPTKDC